MNSSSGTDVTSGMTWEEGYKFCYNMGARLAEIHNEAQMHFLYTVLGI